MKKSDRRQAKSDLFDTANHPDDTAFCDFGGITSPRQLRVVHGLLARPRLTREQLDRVAGCSNGPDLVHELRRKGLQIPCVRVSAVDRDGKLIRHGIYSFSDRDRRSARAWLRHSNCAAQCERQSPALVQWSE
ncbi:hypothetical protein [Caballeronia sp. NCTM1]|uniref:hypothetical protein n=1 Tax=Caballeronia sp. NCTM1 TaxID=2921753 RepID=UPI002027B1E4|nr:hypothetical protein [Caballeronia sp. NCTM1]